MSLKIENKVYLGKAKPSGGGDQHNLGYYATPEALAEAHATAEAGDFAIVGSTDTVWIWDTDTSAWVDSDTKGQVTSVNNQTGAVTLTASDVGALPDSTVIPEATQVSALPTASATEEGKIYQFIGTTDANYTNGYFYKCVSDGGNPATYSWTRVDVQPAPSGLPDQTGQSGKFLTTDGSTASWSDKPLVNTATGTGSFTVGGVASTFNGVTNIGTQSQAYSYSNVLVGRNTSAYQTSVAVGDGAVAGNASYQKLGNVALGYGATTRGDYSIAIGFSAKAYANNAIQISAANNAVNQINSDANTFKVGNANGNFEIMSADGTIPADRLASTSGLADGNYRLRLTMVSGVPTLTWVAE